jgi:cobalt-zinc-cadmium efflux system membrane fusion protein
MRDLGWRPLVIALLLVGCGDGDVDPQHGTAHADEHVTEARGPHGGRVLTTGEFTLELAIFERGTPPEFRAWASKGGAPIAPADVSLTVRLERLGGRLDEISFAPETEFLRGQDVVAEPHSFGVSIAAVHEGRGYDWHYETLEGRTRIAAPVAKALGVATAVAGAARLTEVASLPRERTAANWSRTVPARLVSSRTISRRTGEAPRCRQG